MSGLSGGLCGSQTQSVSEPTCEHCGCRIVGHGVEADGRMFCCAHCAERSGVEGLNDRV